MHMYIMYIHMYICIYLYMYMYILMYRYIQSTLHRYRTRLGCYSREGRRRCCWFWNLEDCVPLSSPARLLKQSKNFEGDRWIELYIVWTATLSFNGERNLLRNGIVTVTRITSQIGDNHPPFVLFTSRNYLEDTLPLRWNEESDWYSSREVGSLLKSREESNSFEYQSRLKGIFHLSVGSKQKSGRAHAHIHTIRVYMAGERFEYLRGAGIHPLSFYYPLSSFCSPFYVRTERDLLKATSHFCVF